MSWFWLAIVAVFWWSLGDLFDKLGCEEKDNKINALKMVSAVGLVMGADALFSIISGTEISLEIIVKYLPVSLLYGFSMFLGYVGMRYIELSILSPVCNSSGAVTSLIALVMCIIAGENPSMNILQYVGIIMCGGGMVFLGIVENKEDDELRMERQKASNMQYSKSFLALALPIGYCILDAAGTFADSIILESMDENSANVAYELTFLTAGIICLLLALFKAQKQKISLFDKSDLWKLAGGACETFGQLAYINALANDRYVAITAPLIATYSGVSVIWGRVFLKEKLSKKHYLALIIMLAGIVILGIFDA